MTVWRRRVGLATLVTVTGFLFWAPAGFAAGPPPTCQPSSQPILLTGPATIALSCTDPSSRPQMIAITANPSHGTLGPVDQTSQTSATVSYTAYTNYNGTDSFTFAASGPAGTSAPAIVSLTVGWVDQYYGAGSPPGWVGPPAATLLPGPPASTGPASLAATPVLSALLVDSETFSILGRSNRSVRLLVSVQLSQAGSISFWLDRVTAGRREGDRCVAMTRANQTRPACARRIRAPGRTTRDLLAGTNAFTVTDRLDRMTLTPGAYELVATPASSGGPGTADTVGFSIPQ